MSNVTKQYAHKINTIQRRLTDAGRSHREFGGALEVWEPAFGDAGCWMFVRWLSPCSEVLRGSDAFAGVFIPDGQTSKVWVSAV